MNLQYSEADQEFRQKARVWLSANVPQVTRPAMGHAAEQFDRDWQRKLYEHGWAGVSWPKEFGGLGLSGEAGQGAQGRDMGIPGPAALGVRPSNADAQR